MDLFKFFVKYTKTLTHCSLETPKRAIGKQCRPRSDATECDQGLHCLQIVQPFSLRISKSHSLTYLKSKLESSNI